MHKHTCKVEKYIGTLSPLSKRQYKFVFYSAHNLFGKSYLKLFIQDVIVRIFFQLWLLFYLICIIAALLLIYEVFKIQHKTVFQYPAQSLSPILFS